MNRVRTAVVGVGHLGRWHAEKYAAIENSDLVAVVDIDGERAREVAAKVGAKAFKDYTEVIGLVDAVSISTPTESHAEIGVEFLKRGVSVLIEKPIAANSREAEDLIEAARRSGALLQVGHLERFNPAVTALEGRIIDPMFIESYRLSPFPGRSMDIDVILDLMIHDIDIILNLVARPVVDIKAVGVPVITENVDIANARLVFSNGCVANVTASRASKTRVREIRLFQHDSFISIDYAAQHISITRAVEGAESGWKDLEDTDLVIERKDSLLEEIRSFVDCVATGREPLVSGADGKRALEVAEKIQDSVRRSKERFMRAAPAAH